MPSEKSLNIRNNQAYDFRCKSCEIPISAWKLKFCHWQQILSIVFLEVTGSLFHCCKDGCQIPKACHSFSQVKIAFHKKKKEATSVCDTNNYQVFSLSKPFFFGMQQMCSKHTSCFHHRTIQKMYQLKGWELQLILLLHQGHSLWSQYLPCQVSIIIKDILKWSWHFILLFMYAGKEYNHNQHSLAATPLIHAEIPEVLPSIDFVPPYKPLKVHRPYLKNLWPSQNDFFNS